MTRPADPASDGPQARGERIVRRCLDLGFALAGIAPASTPLRASEFDRWLSEGKHGEMAYLAEHAAIRKDIQQFLPGTASIVMVADQYADRNQPPGVTQPIEGRVARYAHGRDYHDVIKRRLHTLCDELRADYPEHQFRAFVDTAPVLEREFAAAAGLGWIGKHTLVINPRLGSWLLLGGLATTLELDPGPEQPPVPDGCGTCTRCIDACPTHAITPYSVDARRCISYLTIEQRTMLDPSLTPQTKSWLFGCDVCQEVCPHNSPRPPSVPVGTPRAEYQGKNTSLPLLEVLGWTPEDRSRRLSGSAMKRATLAMFKRNALVALENELVSQPQPSRAPILERIRSIAGDTREDPLVREQANRSLARLERKPPADSTGESLY